MQMHTMIREFCGAKLAALEDGDGLRETYITVLLGQALAQDQVSHEGE